jgi:hypothetical protein
MNDSETHRMYYYLAKIEYVLILFLMKKMFPTRKLL